jgi:nicotinate-nucleotide pyrophosphorylase (carboxylating)
MPVIDAATKEIIRLSLAEDYIADDVTSRLLIPEGLNGQAVLFAKADGIVAGLEVFASVFKEVDAKLKVSRHRFNGERVWPGEITASVRGPIRSILASERVALNFICHLSGVATLTRNFVEAVKGLDTIITDTRKTMPGLRLPEKRAVKFGGGHNHRFNLSDGILIKDNHLAALRKQGLSLSQIVAQARNGRPEGLRVEVEVTCLKEADEAAVAGADILLLDNMGPEAMAEVVAQLKGKVLLEASGGINLANVRAVAETGVDRISIGALTHSAKALDFSLEMI